LEATTFTKDDKLLAAASDGDRTVRLWDSTTGQCLQTLESHVYDITTTIFTEDSKVPGRTDADTRILLSYSLKVIAANPTNMALECLQVLSCGWIPEPYCPTNRC
jgi:WD40 repeat protein